MNNYQGIVFAEYATEMMISENNITENSVGVYVEGSFNIICKNIIANNTECGLSLFGGENIIYHNCFVNNTCQADVSSYWQGNFWDTGYPSGGNYWSDYDGIDDTSGPGQDQPGSDGIGDTPYFICENNVDRYPFIRPEFPTTPIGKPFVILSASSNIVKEDVENVVFTAIAYDFNGYIESYFFDYGDGHESGWVSDSSISWTYSSPGEYKARVKVRDDDGIESDWSYPVNITVTSINKPIAILSAYPTTVKEDVESVTFDASASYDPDGSIVSYFFSFGDGSESGWISSSKVSKVYSEPGSYLAKLKVKDNDGLESDWSNTIIITVTSLPPPPPENQKPTARLSAYPTTVEEDYQSVTLDASASYDPDGSVVAYLFDYGDGTNSGWTTSSKISKIYNNVGEYFVKVKVRDDKGSESDWSDAIKIKVIISPDPFIPENGIVVFPGTPKMGEWYTITIKVFNPSAVKKSVSITLKETGVKTGFGDMIYPALTQGPYEIGPNQNQLFKFTLIHRWDWLHPFIEFSWWTEFVMKEFARYAVAEGFQVSLPGWVFSIVMKSLTLAGSTPEALYSYSITSNVPTIQKEIQVKVEVPQSKKDHIFASVALIIVGGILTEFASLLMNPLTWPFAAALLTSQGISIAASALEWNFARDPPDFNYTFIVSAKSITLSQLDEINDTRSKELVERFLSLYANMEAAKVSFERYQGASIMNDTEWMLKQLEAARVYMSMATKDLIEVKKELDSLIMDAQSTGFTLNLTVIQEIRNNLTDGLPPLEVEILRAFNFTDGEINAIKQGLLGMPDPILLNYTDTLKILDCLIPTFVNITRTYMEMQNEIRTTLLNETALSFHDVAISIDPSLSIAKPGDSIYYTLDAINLGNMEDEYSLVVTCPPGTDFTWVDLNETSLTLSPGQWVKIKLRILVPAKWTWSANTTYTFAITALCKADPEKSQTVYTTVTVILDVTPPKTKLKIEMPQYIDPANNIYISSSTPLTLIAEDDPNGTGIASTFYRIYGTTYDTGWLKYSEPFQLTGLPDGKYSIYYFSVDNAGNTEPTNTEIVILDNTPPITTLTIGEPKYVSRITYVTPDTSFIFEATDTSSGVCSSVYRIYNSTYDSGWMTYGGPFNLTSLVDGTYTIEYYSIDNVQNAEAAQAINVTLFSWNYIFEDTYGRGTILKINLAHKFFQFITPDKDYGIREATYMRQCGRAIIIHHYDEELRLITTAVDTKLDFCVAIAWDTQTGKRYFLSDKVGNE
jgi:hypothetical protein